MALKLLNSGMNPLGQFDGLDADYLNVKGGEVLQFAAVSATGSDKAAKDAFDGYVNTSSSAKRPVLKLATSDSAPIFLADDGVAGYGTLFGTVVGGVAGQVATGGSVLGPHTATASGKLTAWDKPGLYAVSLDACDLDSADGLQPTNTALAVGDSLFYFTADKGARGGKGFLSPDAGAGISTKVAGYFVEFATNGSLVNTPNYLVSALNSPGGLGGSLAGQYAYAVFSFIGPQGA